jgi:hypothetical protein
MLNKSINDANGGKAKEQHQPFPEARASVAAADPLSYFLNMKCPAEAAGLLGIFWSGLPK